MAKNEKICCPQVKQRMWGLFNSGCLASFYSFFIVVGFLLISTGTCASATGFFDTSAAKAFRAGKYELAVSEFRSLAKTNPNNVLIFRYLAISLRQLNQYDESVKIFQYALTLAPKNPSLYFHLGVTYYTMQEYTMAQESFRQAAEFAAGSEYARLSNEYLHAIDSEQRLTSKRQQVSAWGFYLQTGVSYDDNILASPDGKDSSYQGMGYFSARRYFLRQYDDWLGTAEVSGYLTRNFQNDFRTMNTGIYAGSLVLQKTGTWRKLPYITTFKYTCQHVDIDNNKTYSHSHIGELAGKLYWKNRYAAELSYRFTYDNFKNEGFDPEFSSRDGDDHMVTLMGSWYTSDGKSNVDVGIEYHRTSPKGDNFNMLGYELVLQSSIPVLWGLRSDFSLRYGQDEYPEFAGVRERETDRWQATLSLSHWFHNGVYTTFKYSYLDESSNYNILSYRRNRLDLNLGFSFCWTRKI